MLEQMVFISTLLIAGYFFWRRVSRISTSIKLGKITPIEGRTAKRWKNVFLIAFGQKKMFQRFIPAFLHLWVYIGFLVINIEVLEFMVDGVLGTHRSFAPYLGSLYPLGISIFEFLAVAVLVSCVFFLARRNILKIKRFRSVEMTVWPRLDANLILIIEIVLMTAILTMNAADQVLQARGDYPAVGTFFFSSLITAPILSMSTTTLVYIERAAWWFHIVGILGFAIYVTYSKHLHIFLAFPNTYYARLTPKGHISAMPVVTREVNSMLGISTSSTPTPTPPEEVGRLGAKDIHDLSRASLLSAYACTECGRCTSECPAHLTGKKLSPRKIMMDTRDRLVEVSHSLSKKGKGLDDGKSLLDDYITKEEINACTSCNACVEACPILINPLDIILELRRYVAMEESSAPAQWNSMFQNIETNFAPWKFPSGDRFNWSNELKKKTSTQ